MEKALCGKHRGQLSQMETNFAVSKINVLGGGGVGWGWNLFFFFLLLEIQRNYKNLHFLPKPKLSFQNPIEIGYSRDGGGGWGVGGEGAVQWKNCH